MSSNPWTPDCPPVTRRSFLAASARLSAVIAAAPYVSRAAAVGAQGETVNVGVIGCGEQGNVLMRAALNIPGVRFKAVCDIWPFKLTSAQRLLQVYRHDARGFEDYREMLSAVPDLDAVFVATPDFMHAEHTIAALRAGKHVYCEKLMSNTVEGARAMVAAARESRRLLQIGHQRRSNPRYLFARDKLVRGARLLGRITSVSGEWHKAVADDLGYAKNTTLAPEKLAKYGYANMHEFRNWRWFRKYAGGPISDLGAHQIDVYNWMLGANPRAVIASGGNDYYTTHEWYDNASAIYEYATKDGIVRASYDVLTTTSAGGGYHEYFMGDEGALKLSENQQYTRLYREARAPEWDRFANDKLIMPAGTGFKPWEKPRQRVPFPGGAGGGATVDVRETALLSAWEIPVSLDKPIHQPHLENFFDAIRKDTPLNCPGEEAFASTVTVLSVNQAIAAERKLTFAPQDFVVAEAAV